MGSTVPHPHVIRVVVADGPDAGRTRTVSRPLFTIGTGALADLRLSDESVSAEQLQLQIDADGVRLRDLGNGARVGSLRLRDAVLTHSTTIVIGETTLVIEIDEVPPEVELRSPALAATELPLVGEEAVLGPSNEDLAMLPYRQARALAIHRFEQAYVPAVLAKNGNVVVQAARHAGVERESFYRLLGRIREASKSPP